MATVTNAGSNFKVYNFSVGTTGSTIILNDKHLNSMVLQCRTAVDIYIRRSGGDSEYFTLKSGTSLTLDIETSSYEVLHATSSSGTVVLEIIAHIP